MVLEHLFPEDWLEKKLRYAFILAFVYSTISIIVARLLFAANSGLVAVVFTSLFLLPYLQKLLLKEEMAEMREKGGFHIHRFIVDNLPAIKVYATLFAGIYLSFVLYSFILPMYGFDTGVVFREQLAMEVGLTGQAYSWGTFIEILLNNWWVLLACFLVALVAGDGALFFIVWNASTWGAIFGFRAFTAADGAYGAWLNLIIILGITLPHLILEGGAYILAAISGGLISDDIVSKRAAMSRFVYWFLSAFVIFIVLHYLFTIVLAQFPLLISLADVVVVLGMLHLLIYVFDDRRHRTVFRYNYYLFLVAIAIFIIGAVVETLVLSNSTLLSEVYWAAIFA